MKIEFVSVSLETEIYQLKKTIPFMIKNYKDIDYVLIVPFKSIDIFRESFYDYKFVKIIDENKIINKKKYLDICHDFFGKREDFKDFIYSWYYQQFLKLAYCLDFSRNKYATVIWDSDTIPLKKIEFFDKNFEYILYGSNYEYHKNYFEVNNKILGRNIIWPRYSSITQFSVLKFEDKIKLKKYLLNSNSKYKIKFKKYYLIYAILNAINMSIRKSHITTPMFSEYELIATFLINEYSNLYLSQKPIKFFRNYVNGQLNNLQENLLFLFGFKHITYESKDMLITRQSNRKLLISIFNEIKIILRDKKMLNFLFRR